MVQWIHDHKEDAEKFQRISGDFARRHRTFYSVCQAVFYVFVFRHKELMSMDEGEEKGGEEEASAIEAEVEKMCEECV